MLEYNIDDDQEFVLAKEFVMFKMERNTRLLGSDALAASTELPFRQPGVGPGHVTGLSPAFGPACLTMEVGRSTRKAMSH